MNILVQLFTVLIFPCGLFLLCISVLYDWVDHKLVARLQNRAGPRWFQSFADIIKLLVKEEVVPQGVNRLLFDLLPVLALAGALAAALLVPLVGFAPLYSFPGDLIVAVYLLSLLTLCTGLAGLVATSHYSLLGAARVMTQLFAYEAPLLLALLGPAVVAGSWQISEIAAAQGGRWLLLTQPVGFFVILISLMGKVELPPFDAPEAETEIVAGALTEYGGRALAFFLLAKKVVLVVVLTLTAALFMGGIANPLDYFVKTLLLLLLITVIQTAITRLRIDQTLGLWWRYGALLVLAQWGVLLLLGGL